MDASGTKALRGSATHWTLAGDKQLLQLLQDIHEKVVTRCQETNSLLEQMATSMDEASIDVQSVNNKFMSLSNSQFVESRVYGDDADLTTDPVPQKEEPKPPDSPLSKTKQSLQVLDRMHDSFEIYDDTDSESDSDDCVSRTVLKPKDVYSHRPLPYIIGSHNWRTKWHVGLIHESSDSDEDSYEDRPLQKQQYSDNESVREETRERSRTLSSSSSPDRRSITHTAASNVPPTSQVRSPVDIASELARRLGNVGQMPSVSQDFEPPKMSTGKIYRPEQPASATIFPDEPPPLDETVSDGDFEEEDDDIFAELHRTGQKGMAREEPKQITSPPLSKQSSDLFEGDSEPELFAPKPQVRIPVEPGTQDVTDNTVKKPIGGISLFGNNSGAESIGAAILRRNQRKSSSSSDEETEDTEPPKQKTETKTEPMKNESEIKTKENNIIDNLFPKTRNKTVVDKEKTKVDVVKKEQKNLFSDDLFDDIDDIFSSNIVRSEPKSNAQKPKPLFDDDDDLFAEVSVSKPVIEDRKVNSEINRKGLFDSDDELFSDTASKNTAATNSNIPSVKENEVKSMSVSKPVIEERKDDSSIRRKGLFDSDDELFSEAQERSSTKEILSKNIAATNSNVSYVKENEVKNISKPVKDDGKIRKKGLFDSDDELFSEAQEKNSNKEILSKNTSTTNSNVSSVKENKVKSIFDDSSDDDIFDKRVIPKPIRESTIVSDHTMKSQDNEQGIVKSDKNFNAVSKISDEDVLCNKNEKIEVITTDVDNNNSNVTITNHAITQSEIPDLIKDSENNSKHVAFRSPSLFDDDDDLDNLFFKGKSKTEENNARSSEQINTISPLQSNHNLCVQQINNNMEIDSPTVSLDDKSTSRILAEETPFKNKEQESKKTFDVDDSFSDFTQDFDDNESNQSSKSTEDRKSDNTKPVVSSDVSKHYEDQNNDQITKKETKLEDQQNPNEEILQKSSKTNKEIVQNDNSKDSNEEGGLMTSVVTSTCKIFTEEPPAFEKPKESKKSKNINALFDDDSDDEALFFKKSDAPLVDEKPELFPTPDSKTNLFGIFLDEPPDVNVDFTQKDDKTIKNKLENLPVDTKETDSLFKLPEKLDQTKPESKNSEDTNVTETKETKKPIGKLKMNLNINVNTLLPGASPKKTVKLKESVDTENSTNTSTEELDSKIPSHYSTDEKTQIMTRSASFEGDPEAKVLDNKLSKQRPRIQVKRRPSTRKARHEAVRKSVIDLTDDSTDNSSSIDDYSAPKSEEVIKETPLANESEKVDLISNKRVDTYNSKIDTLITKDSNTQSLDTKKSHMKDVKSKIVYILNDEDIFTNTDIVKDTVESKINSASDQNDLSSTIDKTLESKSFASVDHKSSDDLVSSSKPSNNDIFKDQLEDEVSNILSDKPIKELTKKPILNIADDDDLLFKSSTVSAVQPKPVVEAVKNEKPKSKKSLFDDQSEDDDDLFKPKTSKASKPKNIFGSDSDDDIFVSKKKETKTKPLKVENKKKVEVKKSLFSDDDDDDDLFGAKRSSADTKAPPKSTNTKGMKQSEIAFEDPLSMLDE